MGSMNRQSERIFAYFLVAFLSIASAQRLVGQQIEPAKKAPIEVVLPDPVEMNFDRSITQVFAGNLEAGANVSVRFVLTNKTDELITFDFAKPNGTCIDFKISSKEISVNESATVEVAFEIPKGNTTGTHSTLIDLYKSGQVVRQIFVSCGITNGLYLGNVQHLMNLPNSVTEYRIPIDFTAPIKFENLEVTVPASSFEGLDVTTTLEITAQGIPFVSVVSSAVDMPYSFVSGSVIVTDRVSGKQAEARVLISKREPVQISPRRLNFVKAVDDSGHRIANAMLRFLETDTQPNEVEASVAKEELQDADAQGKKRQLQEDSIIEVTAQFRNGDRPLIDVKPLGNQIVRVKVRISEKQFDELDEIIWTLKRGGQRFELVCDWSK